MTKYHIVKSRSDFLKTEKALLLLYNISAAILSQDFDVAYELLQELNKMGGKNGSQFSDVKISKPAEK